MKLTIKKPQTWKGWSYVLKSSMLKEAILDHGLDPVVDLVYWTPQRNNTTDCSLIEAEYWPPNPNVDHYSFYIRTGVVPSRDRKKVELRFANEVLPRLLAWMKTRMEKPENSTTKLGGFYVFYRDGELVF